MAIEEERVNQILNEMLALDNPAMLYHRACMYYDSAKEKDSDAATQDYKEAVKWFRKAADQGHSGAQCGLACMYRDGIEIEQDSEKAVKWFSTAFPRGNARAQEWLEEHKT